MQVLISCVLILGFVSPCLCGRWINVAKTNNNIYNVIAYGARGDGISDDTQVCICVFSPLLLTNAHTNTHFIRNFNL